jgi:predicted nucleic acid-binding Zn ribbon protein
MPHKRHPTAHQKQIRFILVFFSILLLLALVGVLLLLSRPMGGFRF